MRIAITGANGFIGSATARAFRATGDAVTALVRNPEHYQAAEAVRAYNLRSAVEPGLLANIDRVVHCAFERQEGDAEGAYAANVHGTLALFACARAAGIPFTFLSSMSAIPEVVSTYGRQKYELEQRLGEAGAAIVRPGLVVGDGGLVRATYESLQRLHVAPLFDGGRQIVQCVGIEDLAQALVAIVHRSSVAPPVTIANYDSTIARDLVIGIRDRFAIRAVAVSVPLSIALPLVRVAEAAGLRLAITTENLRGLQAVAVQPVTDIGEMLGIRIKAWPQLLRELTFAPLARARQ